MALTLDPNDFVAFLDARMVQLVGIAYSGGVDRAAWIATLWLAYGLAINDWLDESQTAIKSAVEEDFTVPSGIVVLQRCTDIADGVCVEIEDGGELLIL